MIPKIQARGSSFKGLATYLTHDPKEKTDDRVAWTHTLNLAQDHVPSAVDEMLWTTRAAELLKQEAGVRAGGRATENPVKHFSLNWSPEEDPTREQMTKAAEDFLSHMKWQEHQALVVAHNDKSYAHVHVMLNAVHPETGLRLDEDFERRRAQAWALAYEQEHGRIYCEQRLMNSEDREDAPTRPAWLAFKKIENDFAEQENSRSNQANFCVEDATNSKIANFDEWKELKEIQRREREDYFADGKAAFSELRLSIYRKVREEFRERWADLYACQKNGGDPADITALKKEIVAEQNELLTERRDEACADLRQNRDAAYRELLDDQRATRHEMRWRQENELDNGVFLNFLEEKIAIKNNDASSVGDVADETVGRQANDLFDDFIEPFAQSRDGSGMKSELDIGANVASGLGLGLLCFFGAIGDGLIASKPDPKPRQPERELRADPFHTVIEETRKRQQTEQEKADDDWYRKQRSYGD